MNWLELSFQTTHGAYDLVSDIFIEAGSKGVLLEDSQVPHETREDHFGEINRLNPADYPESSIIVKGYLAVTEDIEAQLEWVRTKLLNLEDAGGGALAVTTMDEEDWANSWKKDYHPIQISPKLWVKPSWLMPSDDPEAIEILMDPGMAFGSGTHETTRLCLGLLEKYVHETSHVVDVGTGSGILAIAAAKLGAASVYGVDLDAMAVVRARENVGLNHCPKIIIEKNNLIDGVLALQDKPDLMVANILAPIIISMLPDVKKVLKGVFICSGIVSHEEEGVVAALKAHGFLVKEIARENGWVAIVSEVG
ncbi:MAG: 50S ribosomal protein L11 methyltransferase [Turicibacter sp.]|nr:50S ribosomal protein L11 methyltransferase [Turicibacter sp.]